jgi:hypothetical protein
MASDYEVLTLKEVSEIFQVHQITLYKDGQGGQDSELSDRHRVAIAQGPVSPLDG